MPTKLDLLMGEPPEQPTYAELLAQVAAMRSELDALKAATPAIVPAGPGHPDQWDSTGRLISSDYLNLN